MGVSPQLRLADEPVDERVHVVCPVGDLDAIGSPRLGRRLLELLDQGRCEVVVDLSEVNFMDSTGLGVLLNALRAFSGRNGRLVLVCPTERLMRPFVVTGLRGRLPIVRTRQAALGELAAV